MLLFAILPLALGGWSYFSSKDFVSRSNTTSAEVIDLIENSGSEGGSTYAPRVRFTDSSGSIVEATSRTSSYPPKYQAGDTIEVLYDPNTPQDFRTQDWFSLWGFAIIGLSVGGFGIILSILVAFLGPIIVRGFKTKRDNKAAHTNSLPAPESKLEGNEKPQLESEVRPQ